MLSLAGIEEKGQIYFRRGLAEVPSSRQEAWGQTPVRRYLTPVSSPSQVIARPLGRSNLRVEIAPRRSLSLTPRNDRLRTTSLRSSR